MSVSLDPFSFLVTAIAGWMRRHQLEVIAYLVEENRVLREQIGHQRLKLNDDQRRRLAAKAKKLGRKTLEQVSTIATPETLLTWHRKLIVQNVESPRRRPGRPATTNDIAALAVRMAEENRSWGYRRIQGALANLGHDLAHNTIRNILKRHGIEPAPERSRQTSWKEFFDRHWEQIITSDFFRRNPSDRSCLVPVLVLLGLMKLTLRVHGAGTAGEMDGLSTAAIVRKMTDNMDGWRKEKLDLVGEEPSRRCRHYFNRNKPHVGIRLIVPLSASSQKGSGVRRLTRRDRLLNQDQCEAA